MLKKEDLIGKTLKEIKENFPIGKYRISRVNGVGQPGLCNYDPTRMNIEIKDVKENKKTIKVFDEEFEVVEFEDDEKEKGIVTNVSWG